jgi:hypothetical protein
MSSHRPAEPEEDDGLLAAAPTTSSNEDVIYETADWTEDQRLGFDRLLVWGGANYEWLEAGDLSVRANDEELVDKLLDRYSSGDTADLTGGAPLTFSDDSEEIEMPVANDPEAEAQAFRSMDQLFTAAEVLARRPEDPEARLMMVEVTDELDELPPPFGMDPHLWDYLRDRASAISLAIDFEFAPEIIELDAGSLREVLRRQL